MGMGLEKVAAAFRPSFEPNPLWSLGFLLPVINKPNSSTFC